uniref:O-antigen ligase family protein n=1 Tax=Janthinobacterium sp. TaxID=1871054 RepID=UPI00293D8038
MHILPTTGGLSQARLSAGAALRHLPLTLGLSGVLLLGHFLPPGHDAQRLLQLALLLVFGVALPLRGAWIAAVAAMPPALLVFFVLGLVSSLRAYSPRHAGYELSSLLLLLALALCVAQEMRRDYERALLWVLRLCAAACLLYSCQVLSVYCFSLLSGLQATIEDFAPGFSNYRFLNHAQTVSLPLLVLLAVLDRPAGKARPLWLGLAGFWWALLMLFGARGSIIGLLGAGLAVALLRRRHARALCATLCLTAALGALIYAVFFAALPLALGMQPFGALQDLAQRTAVDAGSGRMPLWRAASGLIAAHPWLGAGPLHFAHYAVDKGAAHPHDWVLQIGAEWGLPALLCLCLAILSAARALLDKVAALAPEDARNHSIGAAWIWIGGAVLVDGLVSGLIVMPLSQLMIALYLGCALAWTRAPAPAPLGPGRRA